MPWQDPAQQQYFAGAERERETVAGYQEALRKLKGKGKSAKTDASRDNSKDGKEDKGKDSDNGDGDIDPSLA